MPSHYDTFPSWATNYAQRHGFGPGSEPFNTEWSNFLQEREKLVDQILARAGLAGQLAQDPIVSSLSPNPIEAASIAADSAVNQQVAQGEFSAPMPTDLNDLFGAARHYGIVDPEKMPPEVLRQAIRQKRLERRQGEGEQTGAALDMVGALAIGTAEGVVNLADGLPFIADALNKRGWINAADQWLAQVGEGFRGDMEGEDVEGLANLAEMFRGNEAAGWEVAKGIANLGTYMIGGAAVWRFLATKVGLNAMGMAAPGMTRASAIARGAIAGAGTEAILEGGGDAPLEEKAMFIALGAAGGAGQAAGRVWETMALGGGIGGGIGYGVGGDIESGIKGAVAGSMAFAAIPRIFRRARKSFPTSGGETLHGEWSHPSYGPEPRPGVSRDVTWATRHAFENRLGAVDQPGQLPPGGPPEIGGGGVAGLIAPDNIPPQLTAGAQALPAGPPNGVYTAQPSVGQQAPVQGLEVADQTGLNPYDIQALASDPRVQATSNLEGTRALMEEYRLADEDLRNQLSVVQHELRLGRSSPALQDQEAELTRRIAEVNRRQRELYDQNYNEVRHLERFPRAKGQPHVLFMPDENGLPTEHKLTVVNEPVLIDETPHFDLSVFEGMEEMESLRAMFAPRVHAEYRLDRLGSDPYRVILSYNPQDKKLTFDAIINARTMDFRDQTDLGPMAVRRYGKKLVEDFRERGFEVETISGQRVTGARRRAGVEGEDAYWEFPVERLYPRSQRGLGAADATAMSKVNQVMESPALADMAQQPRFDDADVARAATSANPAGVSVVRNIGDVGTTIRRLLQQQIEGGVGPQDFRVVRRQIPQGHEVEIGQPPARRIVVEMPGEGRGIDQYGNFAPNQGLITRNTRPGESPWRLTRISTYGGGREVLGHTSFDTMDQALSAARREGMIVETERVPLEGAQAPTRFVETGRTEQVDLLVTAGRGISNRMVREYEQYGMFSGQHGILVNGGQEVIIVRPAGPDGLATVRTVYGGRESQVRGDQIMPGRTSEPLSDLDAPGLYAAFRNFAISEMDREASSIGLGPMDWLGTETSSQLPRLMDKFFETMGFNSPVERGFLQAYFDRARVADFRAMADPEDLALEARLQRELTDAVRQANIEDRLPPTLESAAESRGFRIEEESGGGVVLHDENTGMFYSAYDDEAAEDFLRNFHRAEPDYTPVTDVPAELIEVAPGAPHAGSRVSPVRQVSDQLTELERAVVVMRNAEGGGGGGGGTGGPPRMGGGPEEGPFLPPGNGGGGGGAGRSFQEQIRDLRQGDRDQNRRLAKMLDELQNSWLRHLPMRAWAQATSEIFARAGITGDNIHNLYRQIVTGVAQAHNESIPYYDRVSEILAPVRSRFIRKGYMTRLLEMEPEKRMRAAQRLGLNEKEINALGQIRHFFDTAFEEAGLDASTFLFNYMPHVRNRARAGHRNPYGDIPNLPQEIQFFAEYARAGNIDFREMNVGVLMNHWVRAWQFKKHVGESFEALQHQWLRRSDTGDWVPRNDVPERLAEDIKEWLHVVRFGHTGESEILVQGVGQVLRKFGLPITDNDVMSFYNFAFVNSYRAMLGLRPDVWFRDAIQPLLTASRLGKMHQILPVYSDFMKDAGKRAEMWERALRHGWVEKGMVQVENAGVFAQGMPETVPGGLDPTLAARREKFAGVGDFLRDITPEKLRGGIQGTWLDPLFVYTKEGEFNRLISGEMGWRKAESALQNFRRRTAEATNLDDFPPLMDELMEESGANTWRGAIQREFRDLVEQGNDEAAQALLANEAANMQFRYGTREHSLAVQQAGMKGRMVMMLGTFTHQYGAEVLSGLAKDIPARHRVGFAVRQSAVMAAVAGVGLATGYNLNKYLWGLSLTFAGGPPFQALVSRLNLYGAMANEATGQYVDPAQRAAGQEWARKVEEGGLVPQMAQGVAQTFFPYAGGIRTAQGLGQAITGPGGMGDVPRFLLTGEQPRRMWERGAAETFEAWTNTMIEQEHLFEPKPAAPTPGGGAQ